MRRPKGRSAQPARDHLGWWLMIECACGYHVDYPIALLVKERGPETDLNLIGTHLRCTSCGRRPAGVALVDRPDRVSGGFGGGKGATIKPLPV